MAAFEGPIARLTLAELPRLTPARIGSLGQDDLFVLLSKFEHDLSAEQTAVARDAVEALLQDEDELDDDDGFVVDATSSATKAPPPAVDESPGAPERRRRNSLNEAVSSNRPASSSSSRAAPPAKGGAPPSSSHLHQHRGSDAPPIVSAVSSEGGSSGCSSGAQHGANGDSAADSPTVDSSRSAFVTTTEEDTGSEAAPGDDMSSFTTCGGGDGPGVGGPASSSGHAHRAAPPPRSVSSVDNLDSECTAKRRAKAADDAREFSRALKWIFAVLDMPEKLPADAESRPEECFGDQLKDGVLLCKLLNRMKPGLIKKITKHSTIPFHQMSNITSFLRACQSLGVKRRDCFDTVDLQQLKDLSKVYETLLALSRAVQKHHREAFAGPFLYSSKREERLLRQQRSSGLSTDSVLSEVAETRGSTTTLLGPSHRFGGGGARSVVEDDAVSDAGSAVTSLTTFSLPPSVSEAGDLVRGITTLEDFVRVLSLEKYASALAEVADDLNDLKEMTDDDFDAFVTASKMSKLKARRFKTALVDLGARLEAQ